MAQCFLRDGVIFDLWLVAELQPVWCERVGSTTSWGYYP